MTKFRTSFVAAIGFLTAGLVGAAPASAGPLNVAKPVITVAQPADLHQVDRGGWRKKKYFKSKKHFRGGDHYRGGYFHDDDYRFKRHKKKKYKRGYRHGYEDGYDRGRRDNGRYYDRGHGRYGSYRPRHRGRRHHHHGSGFIRTPGFYFRF